MTAYLHAEGLMAFWADIDTDYLLRFQQWHNCEHVPERVSIPGFLRGRRYRAKDCSAHFLMMYETETPDALTSDAYLAALNAPTVWTQEALTHFRNPARNIYSKTISAGAAGPFCSPWLTSVRFNRAEGLAAQDMEAWAQAIAATAGVERVQIWAVDEEASGIQTNERKIYGDGPGAQQFLLLIEAHAEHPVGLDSLTTADTKVPEMAKRQDEIIGQYWLEICHETPSI